MKQNNHITELVFILDRSGSMAGLESDTIGGFNAMIAEQKKKDGDTVYVSTVLFDNVSEVLHDRVPLSDIRPLTNGDYTVRGCTALLDAIGDAVHHIRNIHKYARPEDVPANTLFVITTDGMENASRRYSYQQIRGIIEQQKESGWEFLFIGANIDAVNVASRVGISANRTANYCADEAGTCLLYASMAEPIDAARAARPMSAAWNKKLNDDHMRRGK
ncbi:MAG: VWA domain-containing protein [Oscillospiraceae bacterium]|nr:VWA domain-containing protein [Oscillospiraceae bacterium]